MPSVKGIVVTVAIVGASLFLITMIAPASVTSKLGLTKS